MKIFAVMPSAASPALDAKILAVFANNQMKIAPNQWLVASNATAAEVSQQLDITRVQDGKVLAGSVGNAIVFAVSTYFGLAPTNIWEWLKTKTEAPS